MATCGKTTTSRSGRTGGRDWRSEAMRKKIVLVARLRSLLAALRAVGRSLMVPALSVTCHTSQQRARSAMRPTAINEKPRAFARGFGAIETKRRLRFFLLSLWCNFEQRRGSVHDRAFRHLHLLDVLACREIEHDFGEQLLENRAEAASSGAALERFARHGAKGRVLESELHFLELEELGVLLRERILRFLQNANQRVFVECLESDRDRQTANELWDQAEAKQIVRLDFGEWILRLGWCTGFVELVESDLAATRARFDDLLETVERAAADEENILRVDLDILLLRMLASALRRHRRDRALEDLQQRLLHAFAGDVARDARVFRLPGDLIDLVDVD